ncbi:hypothetical protein IR123_01990 [Streptococcus sp. 19428wC2_LYSM12]|uniref:hypothetical protein n=1 Tax=unclassified Streptococcus TaxID=2608887 RepID=UPI001072D816|nr:MULTISPECIES: hypothetical protein [unclassified Streptococcus]MBF0786692.1 hypothetical protein [Streptococcus sp. 19428wC2_LYSM12]TFV06444.1 hypothetical protein E4T79_01975 [Streptococcus sp. LYSM12]HEN7405676.1 hypothetical protein [Streptococcus agalactiae]
MTNKNKPLVYSISQPTSFSGKDLIGFLQIAHKEATGEFISSSWPLSIIEPSFLEDESGNDFWTKELALHILEYRLKEDYDIKFHEYQKDGENLLVLVIEDLKLFKSGLVRLLDDLLNPNKKYLLYRMFIKTYRTMSVQEKLEYHQKKMREEIARKKSSKK